jgi:hypothetical protein
VLDAKAAIGECPVWSPEERVLYWIDIPRGRLNRLDPATGKNTFWVMPAPIGSFALREAGGFLVALKNGFHLFDPKIDTVKLVAHPSRICTRTGSTTAAPTAPGISGRHNEGPDQALAAGDALPPRSDGHVTPMQSASSPRTASPSAPTTRRSISRIRTRRCARSGPTTSISPQARSPTGAS